MPLPIIREGRRGGLFQDPESARAAGVRPTGHVVDGGNRPSNLILRAGNRSRTQMLGEVPMALAFEELEGELDLSTGEIRAHGPAFVMEKGQQKGVVADVRLELPVVKLLSSLHEVAADQERHGHVDCATAVFKGVPLG